MMTSDTTLTLTHDGTQQQCNMGGYNVRKLCEKLWRQEAVWKAMTSEGYMGGSGVRRLYGRLWSQRVKESGGYRVGRLHGRLCLGDPSCGYKGDKIRDVLRQPCK